MVELKAQLYVCLDAGLLDQPQFEALYRLATDTENLIGGFMRYLSETEIKGSKYK